MDRSSSSDRCRTSVREKTIGGIAKPTGSFYNEFTVELTHPANIVIVDALNRRYNVSSNRVSGAAGEPCVIVTHRISQKVVQPSQYGLDSSASSIERIVIPYSILFNGPVYCDNIGMTLCIENSDIDVLNPGSLMAEKAMGESFSRMLNHGESSPIIIRATDPKNRYKRLYIEIDGNVCEVPVIFGKGIQYDDEFRIYYRNHLNETSETCVYNSVDTTISELEKVADGGVAEWNGYYIGFTREALIHAMSIRKHEESLEMKQQSAEVLVAEKTAKLNKIFEKLVYLLTCLDETEKRVVNFKRSHELDERKVDLQMDKLKYDQIALAHQVASMISSRVTEAIKHRHDLLKLQREEYALKMKHRERKFSLITLVAKGIAVIGTLAIAAIKLLSTKKKVFIC